jgi:hypothetical protein
MMKAQGIHQTSNYRDTAVPPLRRKGSNESNLKKRKLNQCNDGNNEFDDLKPEPYPHMPKTEGYEPISNSRIKNEVTYDGDLSQYPAGASHQYMGPPVNGYINQASTVHPSEMQRPALYPWFYDYGPEARARQEVTAMGMAPQEQTYTQQLGPVMGPHEHFYAEEPVPSMAPNGNMYSSAEPDCTNHELYFDFAEAEARIAAEASQAQPDPVVQQQVEQTPIEAEQYAAEDMNQTNCHFYLG